MRIENLFLKREKELPAEATTNGHKLSLRGGFVHQTAAGIYTYSSIGWAAIQNISSIIRDEMNKAGAQEIFMPVLSPVALWRETKRENMDVLLKFKNRSGQELALNPTHEEIVVDYARGALQSYKQLPFTLYQIQDKYRDEARARAGIMRGREFLMKDAYSFHATDADLDATYEKILEAYKRIYKRLGLENVIDVLAPGGDMSSRFSHEFQWMNDTGEDIIYVCQNNNSLHAGEDGNRNHAGRHDFPSEQNPRIFNSVDSLSSTASPSVGGQGACGYRSNKEILTNGDKEADDILVCPKCGGELRAHRAVEVGNIFRLGDKYSKPMKLEYTDEKGERKNPVMGCYGIGVSRCLGALLEQSGSDSLAKFNLEVAPYKVHIITLGSAESSRKEAEKLYEELLKNNIPAIIDTTDDRAGSKFANADLLGAPVRIISSDKNIANGQFEIKSDLLPATLPVKDTLPAILRTIK
ncbi:MAG: hypothetical protein LBH81_01175 [Rickettsiales bacterium]|jgi:prolyl-tRNA synthetase|nr:hypothetical protein [Rickettsiales bacterium]